MKFETPLCPQCGEAARGTLETVPGVALVDMEKDGEAAYTGETKIFWDDQTTQETDGKAWLICPQGHAWQTEWTR